MSASKPDSVIGMFGLGILPYLNASIIMQLLTVINPKLSKMQKEGGSLGRKTIGFYTRLLCLTWAFIQGLSIAFSLKGYLFDWNSNTPWEISLYLTTGSMIVLWISELITKYGIINGASILISLNLLQNWPKQLFSVTSSLNLFGRIVLIGSLGISIGICILLQESTTQIQIISAKKISKKELQNNKKEYIPFKLNPAGVLPIVFASYVISFLISVFSFIFFKMSGSIYSPIKFLGSETFFKIFSMLVEFILICLFTSFYSRIILNPKDIAEKLKKSSSFLPGIRPGRETDDYIKTFLTKFSFLGGIILGLTTLFLNIVGFLLNLPNLQGIGITVQIIVVGVLIEIVQKMKVLVISDTYK